MGWGREIWEGDCGFIGMGGSYRADGGHVKGGLVGTKGRCVGLGAWVAVRLLSGGCGGVARRKLLFSIFTSAVCRGSYANKQWISVPALSV